MLYAYNVLSSMLFPTPPQAMQTWQHSTVRFFHSHVHAWLSSCSLLSLLFFQGIWIKMEFYHREAINSCSCMIQPGKKSVGETPRRHWGESSSSTASAEKIPGSIVQTKTDKVALQHSTPGKTCFLTKTALWSIQELKNFKQVFVQRGYRL